MRKEDWQRAYVPQGDALDMKVKHTLASLDRVPQRRISTRRVAVIAMAAVLTLVAAMALAAGLMRSAQYDAKLMAQKALAEQYGITRDMDTFFTCTTEEENGSTVLTFTPFDSGVDAKLGTYTVTIAGGKAQAVWSHDGEPVGEDFTSPVWDAALFSSALERRKAGEEWYEILRTDDGTQENLITEETALVLARAAVTEKFGADALDAYTESAAHIYVDTIEAAQDGHAIERYSVWFMRPGVTPEAMYAVNLYADDGTLLLCEWRIDAPEGLEDALPATQTEEGRRLLPAANAALKNEYGLTDEALALFIPWLTQADGGARITYAPNIPNEYGHIMLDVVNDDWQSAYAQQSDRMGRYTVSLNANGEVEHVTWTLSDSRHEACTADNWGQMDVYDGACLERLAKLIGALQAIDEAHDPNAYWYTPEEEAAKADLMRQAGFSAQRYNSVLPGAGEMTQEQALARAYEAVTEEYGIAKAEFSGEDDFATCTLEAGKTLWSVYMYHETGIYVVEIDAADGTIVDVIYDSGLAGNG